MSKQIDLDMAIECMNRLYAEDVENYGVEIPEGFNKGCRDRAIFALKQLPSAEIIRGQDVPDINVGDMIYRSDALACFSDWVDKHGDVHSADEMPEYRRIEELPSAEPEIKPISYQDCSNAMLMMWMDNVITDGEYNRIMDKLNAKHMAERRTDE